MDFALGVIFLTLELVCIALALLAIMRTGFARLGSAMASLLERRSRPGVFQT